MGRGFRVSGSFRGWNSWVYGRGSVRLREESNLHLLTPESPHLDSPLGFGVSFWVWV